MRVLLIRAGLVPTTGRLLPGYRQERIANQPSSRYTASIFTRQTRLTLAATLVLAVAVLGFGVPAQRGAAAGDTIFVVSSQELLRIDDSSDTFGEPPSHHIAIVGTLTGLQAGEELVAIDFRPATGQLYGIGDTRRLYTIDTATAVATQVGMPFALADPPTVSMDFNPVDDRIRVISAAGENFRLHPDTGAVVGTDTDLAYDAGDVNADRDPNVLAIGHSNNFAGATATTLYGIDNALRNLVRQGGVDGAPSANSGMLFTVGPLGAYSGTNVGLDVGSTGTAFGFFDISVPPSFGPYLFTIDLATGTATRLGGIGSLYFPIDIAVQVGPATPAPAPAPPTPASAAQLPETGGSPVGNGSGVPTIAIIGAAVLASTALAVGYRSMRARCRVGRP